MTHWLSTIPPRFPATFFISYSSLDSEMASEIEVGLEKAGHEVWRDRTSLHVGDYWKQEVEFAISHSDEIVSLITPNSIKSEPVKYELFFAIKNKKRVNLFTTFDVKSNPEIYNIISSVNYVILEPSEVSAKKILNRLIPEEPSIHPVNISEFEWKASRAIFPSFNEIIERNQINTSLAHHYFRYSSTFTEFPQRANGVTWVNLALCASATGNDDAALSFIERASQILQHPTLNYFHACLLLGKTRPRHLPPTRLKTCIQLTEQAISIRKTPLTALLLSILLSDGQRAKGPQLQHLFINAIDAIKVHEFDLSELRRFLLLVPLTQDIALPIESSVALKILKKIIGDEYD